MAGVCVGLAGYFGVDVNLIRLGFGVFTVFWGLGALVYGLAWAMLPEEGEPARSWSPLSAGSACSMGGCVTRFCYCADAPIV